MLMGNLIFSTIFKQWFIQQRNPSHLRIWVKYSYGMLGFFLVLLLILAVASAVAIPKGGVFAAFVTGIFAAIVGVIVIGISAYYISVVKKYADIMEEENNRIRVRPKV